LYLTSELLSDIPAL